MRLLVNAPATLTARFDADPGDTTVEVTRDDGSEVVAAGTATEGSGTSRTYALAAVDNNLLDRLTVTWTTTSQGTLTTYADVVGGRYVMLADIRDQPDVGDSGTDEREAAREWAESLIEGYCETSFVPRYGRFTGYGRGTANLVLPLRLRALRWATVDGDTEDLDDWEFETWGSVARTSILSPSYMVEVGYEYGWDAPPPEIVDACLALARFYLLERKGRMFDRARAVDSDFGIQLLSVPGPDRPSGFPFIDSVLNRYRENVPTVA